jgi:hypothetical protein
MAMTMDRVRRLGGLAGIVFVVTGAVALVLPGTPPKADESEKVGSFFADKHDQILAGNYIVGIAFVFFLLFAAALRSHLGAVDRDGLRPGAVLLPGAAVGTALVLAGAAVLDGAVFQVAAADDRNLNVALYHVSSQLFSAAGFGLAAFFVGAGMAIATTRALPNALAPTAIALGVLNAIAPVTFFADSGFFAIGGEFGFVVPALSLLWIVAASVAMLRRRAPGGAAPAGG